MPMSENNSLPSQTSESPSGDDENLTADLDLRFDGAEDILRNRRRKMRHETGLIVSVCGCNSPVKSGGRPRENLKPGVDAGFRRGPLWRAQDGFDRLLTDQEPVGPHG